MITQYPVISVLMPAYNAEAYIAEAIESILNQTFKDFEFLIINDGSTDTTENIIKSYKDSRIKLVSSQENKGLIYSLNKGLNIARGKYIARMDADDVSVNTRFEKQVQYLDNNNDVVILGTAYRYLNTDYEIHHPTFNESIRVKLLDNPAFAHPSVMMKKSALQGIIYNSEYKNVEDYDFWIQAAINNLKMANIDEVLLLYRQHEGQISSAKIEDQQILKYKVRLKYLSHFFGKKLSQDELLLVYQYSDQDLPLKLSILDKLSRINGIDKFFDQKLFDNYINILIYRNIPSGYTIPLNQICRMIRNGISFKFILTLLKIDIKRLLKK